MTDSQEESHWDDLVSDLGVSPREPDNPREQRESTTKKDPPQKIGVENVSPQRPKPEVPRPRSEQPVSPRPAVDWGELARDLEVPSTGEQSEEKVAGKEEVSDPTASPTKKSRSSRSRGRGRRSASTKESSPERGSESPNSDLIASEQRKNSPATFGDEAVPETGTDSPSDRVTQAVSDPGEGDVPTVEADASGGGEETAKRPRRRRRRRGRGRRSQSDSAERDSEETPTGESQEGNKELGLVASSEPAQDVSAQDSAGDPDDRELDDREPAETDAAPSKRRPTRGRGRRRSSRSAAKKGPDADEIIENSDEQEDVDNTSLTEEGFVEGDEEDGDGGGDTTKVNEKRAVPAHRGIRSWEEAIGFIVDTNLEHRNKRPNTSGSRPRGRGGRRRKRSRPEE